MKQVMNGDTVVDISQNPATLFIKYDALNQGKEFVIHNTSDPKHLYNQLLVERGNTFSWEYLEKGPVGWFVRITKQENERSSTIGQIVAADYRKAKVFNKYGLDFCFSGKKTLHQACVEKKIPVSRVERQMRLACLQPPVHQVNYNYWAMDFMTDFILNNHHQYVRESLPLIFALIEKILKSNALKYPHLNGINVAFGKLAQKISDNMITEEQVVFPYIRFLVQVKKEKVIARSLPGSLEQSIKVMEAKNNAIGVHLKELRTLSNHYTIPKGSSKSYTLLYKWLQAFDDDLQLHAHLENNVLFPKAIDLEREYNETTATLTSDPIKLSMLSSKRPNLL